MKMDSQLFYTNVEHTDLETFNILVIIMFNIEPSNLNQVGVLILRDDALIRKGSFMQTKHLFVLIHIRIKVEVGAVKHV